MPDTRTDGDAIAAAERAAAAMQEFARSTLSYPETPPGWSPDRACHYVVFGAHVDPDLGVNYVPTDEPVTPYRRRKIGRRNGKVDALRRWLCESFAAGVDPKRLKRELRARQKHEAIAFAACPEDLLPLLARAMAHDLLPPEPGCIGDCYHGISTNGLVLFGWKEQWSCEGGITNRYDFAPAPPAPSNREARSNRRNR